MYADKNEGMAVYGINSYVWKLLEKNLGWKKENYTNGTPIIPSAQQPELMAGKAPFLVYGSAVRTPGHLYVHREESLAYNVYATTSTEVNKIISLLSETFDRQDEAAADVNEWLDVEARGRGYRRNLSFTTIKTTLSERAEPADEEAGRVSGFILLEYKFIAGDTGIVTDGFTYP
jgi:hypothetical protein